MISDTATYDVVPGVEHDALAWGDARLGVGEDDACAGERGVAGAAVGAHLHGDRGADRRRVVDPAQVGDLDAVDQQLVTGADLHGAGRNVDRHRVAAVATAHTEAPALA